MIAKEFSPGGSVCMIAKEFSPGSSVCVIAKELVCCRTSVFPVSMAASLGAVVSA